MSSNTVYELDYANVVILLSFRLFLFVSLIYPTRYCICLVSAFVCHLVFLMPVVFHHTRFSLDAIQQ